MSTDPWQSRPKQLSQRDKIIAGIIIALVSTVVGPLIYDSFSAKKQQEASAAPSQVTPNINIVVQQPQTTAPARPAIPQATSAPSCPVCGSVMVKRTNHTDGSKFWGCSQFPKCRGTRRID